MLSCLRPIASDSLRIFRLLNPSLRLRAVAAFVLMFLQSLAELLFILVLTYMTLAVSDSAALSAKPLFQALFLTMPPLRSWAEDPRHLLLLTGGILVLVSAGKNLLNYMSARYIALLGEDISFYFGMEIMDRFLRRDYAWHLSPESASMFQRMLWRANVGLMLTHLLTLYACILTLVVLLFSLMGQEPVLTSLVIAVTVSLGIVLYAGLRRDVDTSAARAADSDKEETRALTYASRGIREVLIYRRQAAFLQALADAALKGRKPRTFMCIASTIPTWVLEGVGFAVVVICILYLVSVQQASISRITAALTLLLLTAWRVLPYCNRLVSLQISIRSLRPKTYAVFDLLEALRAFTPATPVVPAQDFVFARAISLHAVSFTYPGAKKPSLHGIDLTIRKGEKIALIGPSGAGKSTLAGVLSGLLPPADGHICVDGQALTQERAAALAMRMGYVPQVPFLFAGTLAENVAFSQWGAPWDEDRVRKACAQAAIDFVDTHPLGVKQPIGENGTGLSGGQAQRVSIARALYPDPEVIIFDEATSALDQANENAIRHTIERLAHNVTCILIAHRLSTVEQCDRIIWLEHGHIVMEGSPKEVLPRYMSSMSRT